MATETPKRTRNWPALDAAHRKRGAFITVLFDPHAAAFAPAEPTSGRGRPLTYSDAHIEALLTVKVVLRLSLRAVEGFATGMATLVGAAWAVPNYSTLSRREGGLSVDLGAVLAPGKRHVLGVDSTGLKVFGEGEWKVRKHGTDGKRRTWKKLHLLVDRESGAIVSVETTRGDAADCPVLPGLLPLALNGDFVLGDGAYHTRELHREVHARGGTLLTPPPVNAVIWKPYNWAVDEPAFRFRNSQLTPLKLLGRTAWKGATGLGQRSFVECTNNRLKSITGERLAARTDARQVTEVRFRCKVLNALAVPRQALSV